MAEDLLKEKIREVLEANYFGSRGDLVDVSDGDDDESIHIVVVSRKFDGRRMKEKHDLIWSLLVEHLTSEEWGRVSLSVGKSPAELKTI